LRLAFVDTNPGGVSPTLPYRRPLGGAQSCLAYLAPKLAALGNEVFLFNADPVERREMGVALVPLDDGFLSRTRAIQPDAIVYNHFEAYNESARELADVPLVLWFHSAPQFPQILATVFERREGRFWFDRVVFVSQWQKRNVERACGIEPHLGVAIPNGVSDRFLELARDPVRLASDKLNPWHWAYTSTPFRGLDLLVRVVEAANASGYRPVADVYSSMKVYGADDQAFGGLYARIANTPGMRHHGSIDQAALSESLRRAAVLAYPSTYPETFCIAAAEAMAAGCKVVSTDFGALPETTGGFAELAPMPSGIDTLQRDYAQRIVAACLALASESFDGRLERVAGQAAFVRSRYDWSVIAHQWNGWLETIARAHRERPPSPARPLP